VQKCTRSVGEKGRAERYKCLLSPRAFRSAVDLISSKLEITFADLGFKSP
jgi:hypothetical protein